MTNNGFQVACLDLTFCASFLKSIDDPVESLFQFCIDVIGNKASRKIVIINRSKKFLKRINVRLHKMQQTNNLEDDQDADDSRHCHVFGIRCGISQERYRQNQAQHLQHGH